MGDTLALPIGRRLRAVREHLVGLEHGAPARFSFATLVQLGHVTRLVHELNRSGAGDRLTAQTRWTAGGRDLGHGQGFVLVVRQPSASPRRQAAARPRVSPARG